MSGWCSVCKLCHTLPYPYVSYVRLAIYEAVEHTLLKGIREARVMLLLGAGGGVGGRGCPAASGDGRLTRAGGWQGHRR